MTINKLNYETYALDYLEGCLSEELNVEMKQFLVLNPEIEAEFLTFKSMLLTPDTSIVFEEKEELKRPPIVAKASFVSWGGWLFSGILLIILSWLFIKSIKTQAQTQTTQKILLETPLMEIEEFVKENTLLSTNIPLKLSSTKSVSQQDNAPNKMTLLDAKNTTIYKETEVNSKTQSATSMETETVYSSQSTDVRALAEEDGIYGFATNALYPTIEAIKEASTSSNQKEFDKTVFNIQKDLNQDINIKNTVKQSSIMTLTALSSILPEAKNKDWYYPEIPIFKPNVKLQISLGYVKDLGFTLPNQNPNTPLGETSSSSTTEFQAVANYQMSPYYALQTGIGLTWRSLAYSTYQTTMNSKPIDLNLTHRTVSIPLYLVHSIPFVIDKAPRFNVTIGGSWNKYSKSNIVSSIFSLDNEDYLYEIERNGSSFSFYNGLEYLLMNNKKQGKLGIEVGYHHQFTGLNNSRLWTYDTELKEKINLVHEDIQSFKYLVFKIKYTPNL